MIADVDITVTPDERYDETQHRKLLAVELGVSEQQLYHLRLQRSALDARAGRVRFHLRFRVWVEEEATKETPWKLSLRDVNLQKPVVIIGAGPAGLFAALKLIEIGLKPVILERGKAVRERRRDIAILTKQGIVHPDSNYCFGEGGAGTFSDGKLYTRSHKRGSIERILQILHYHGASEDILINTHPHIGTNKLPAVVEAIRQTIVDCGGEFHFESRMTELLRKGSDICGVRNEKGDAFPAEAVILATGHSARDIFELLHREQIALELKPFALGVRIEHPQSLIDEQQYRAKKRHSNVPAASYALRTQVQDHGVFSFCMCPGGIICPAATSEGEIVVNGWSPSKRNSYFANSGIVVEIHSSDLDEYRSCGPLAALRFQQAIEQKAFRAGGGRQVAPAQRLEDFLHRRQSKSLPRCSYLPGIESVELDSVLPGFVAERLRKGLRSFERNLKGFLSNDGIAVGVESRTSSPVRIPRQPQSLMHPQVAGLFPCGEGAGYAGGILSAAMDGERIAEAVGKFLHPNNSSP